MSSIGYDLADVEELNAQSSTFHIPDRSKREKLVVGDIAKLVFDGENGSERMWVVVKDIKVIGGERIYVGSLDSNPVILEVAYGDDVVFGPEHIASIYEEARS